MKKYKIDVWYRYVSYGDVEKDFETHNIVANNQIEAIELAKKLYPSRTKIPFQINIIKN